MVQFQKHFINFALIGLIIFSMFAFITKFQEDNNVSPGVMEDATMNATYSDLKDTLDALDEDTQTQKTLFENEDPKKGYGTLLLFSIVSSGKVFNSMIMGIFNTIVKLPVVALGIDPVIISVIITILMVTIIISLWILYKLGG